MYLGVDIGGTKTLVAVLDEQGVIVEQGKFLTPSSYDQFLRELKQVVATFGTQDFQAGGIGMPVTVFDREHERAVSFGNLPWRQVAVQHDIESITHCPMATENDAKLAGLSEAMLLKDHYNKVLYLTVSTGIGIALINKQAIDVNIGDAGGRSLLLEHQGKLVPWESFASGHAIVKRFGKKAMDITDHKAWETIARDLAQGVIQLIALTEPEVIVIGGSVGAHFERYGSLLQQAVERYQLPLVKIPPIIGAERPEKAVIYGCYDYGKQIYPHAAAHH